jgi:hypothetical protein
MINLFLYFVVLVGIFLSSIAGLYSISGLIIIFKGNIIATTLMAITLEVSKISISIYIHVFWKKANKFLLTYLTFALLILMMITSAGVYSYLSKSYMTSTDTDVIYEKIKLAESQIETEKEKIKNKQEEIKNLKSVPLENRDNGYYYKINGLNAKITDYTNTIEKITDSITPLKNKVLEINMEIGPLKYISLLLYQSEGKAAIDKSVQVFIGIVVMVFDPLAILLIFSGIHGLHKRKDEMEKIKNELEEKKEADKEIKNQLKLEKEKKAQEKLEKELEIQRLNKEKRILEKIEKRKKIKMQKAAMSEENKLKAEIASTSLLEEHISSKIDENTKELAEIKKVINIINPKIEDEKLPDIPPPEQETIKETMIIPVVPIVTEIEENKKILKIKKKEDVVVIDEKKIIPPLIKNRPKKIKRKRKTASEKKENDLILQKENDLILQKENEIDNLYNNKIEEKIPKIIKINKNTKKYFNDIEEDNLFLEKKINDKQADNEKKIDYLYNGERKEDYLIKYETKKRKKN